MRTFIGAAALALVLGTTMPAHSAQNIVVGTPGSYQLGWATPNITLSKALPSILVNFDVDLHDVVTNGKRPNSTVPWIETELLGTGEYEDFSAQVATTPVGSYPFKCSKHGNMTGTLTITA